MEFIAGVESELSRASMALTIQLVDDVDEEIEVYKRWWGEHRVDGVLMVDPRVDDPRIGELDRLGLPAVVIGGPLENCSLPAVWHDEASVVTEAVQYLAALGHERIAQVAGVSDFVHTRQRTAALRAGGGGPRSRVGDRRDRLQRRERRARDAQAPVLARPADGDRLRQRPARRHRASGSRSRWASRSRTTSRIIGWDDSLISQVVHPPLTAITRDIEAYGVAAARRLLAAIDGRARSTSRPCAGSSRSVAAPGVRLARCDAPKNELTLNRISDEVHTVTLDGSRDRFRRGKPGSPASPLRSVQANQTEAPTSQLWGQPTEEGHRTMRIARRTKGVAGAIVVFVAVAAASLGVAGAGASEQDRLRASTRTDLLHER